MQHMCHSSEMVRWKSRRNAFTFACPLFNSCRHILQCSWERKNCYNSICVHLKRINSHNRIDKFFITSRTSYILSATSFEPIRGKSNFLLFFFWKCLVISWTVYLSGQPRCPRSVSKDSIVALKRDFFVWFFRDNTTKLTFSFVLSINNVWIFIWQKKKSFTKKE